MAEGRMPLAMFQLWWHDDIVVLHAGVTRTILTPLLVRLCSVLPRNFQCAWHPLPGLRPLSATPLPAACRQRHPYRHNAFLEHMHAFSVFSRCPDRRKYCRMAYNALLIYAACRDMAVSLPVIP
jgi:hypothetical protein